MYLGSELLSSGVEGLHVALDLFLFDGTIAHGVDEWWVAGVLNGQDPLKEDIVVAAGDGPESGGGTFGDGDDVLDIKIGFNAVVGVRSALFEK